MGINIDMSNMTIGGNAKILNDASFSGGDVDVKMSGTHIDGDAVLMQGFVINDFYAQLNEKIHSERSNKTYLYFFKGGIGKCSCKLYKQRILISIKFLLVLFHYY